MIDSNDTNELQNSQNKVSDKEAEERLNRFLKNDRFLLDHKKEIRDEVFSPIIIWFGSKLKPLGFSSYPFCRILNGV